jgi:hypothetical protein
MTEWWERGYPGGEMVRVAGFPRALYPPNAAQYGHPYSVDGPDVEAYKITVSRAGRWPWQAFDRDYSDPFAHGKSGMVPETGVAGVQRQQHIDDTGWIGKTTFNCLRSILIPEPLEHAGEYAMNAYAVSLINEAWNRFGGHEPPPPDVRTLRLEALDLAATQIGYAETGNNDNKYGDWYGMNGQPWCAIFCTWAFETSGDSPSFVRGSRYAYVPYIVGDARAGRYGLHTTDSPIPGDLVCYDWDWNGEHDHVGIFEGWAGGSSFRAVEGNTSSADYSNGGMVLRTQRSTSGQGTVFVRVDEP